VATQQNVSPEQIAQVVSKWEQDKKVDLVFQGGGVLGIGLVGAYSVLESSGFKAQNVAGTSAGAIVATLIGAGYSATQIHDIIDGLDFKKMMDDTVLTGLPLVGKLVPGQVLSIIVEQGLYKGDFFLHTMREHLNRQGVHTFGDLRYGTDQDEPAYRYKVQVIASDVSGRALLRLPLDADKLGYDPDKLPVADAVRMSMSIPFFFEPVRWPNPRTHDKSFIVDGGMLSNFPIWLFDSQGVPEWPTFGIKFVDDPREDLAKGISENAVGGTVDYIKALVETMTKFHDRLYLDSDAFARTITVPTAGISSTNFGLTSANKTTLFDGGQAAAKDFLEKKWTFAGYIAAFRSGAPLASRSELIIQRMNQAAEAANLQPTHVGVVMPGKPGAEDAAKDA
jgi:NTE family protein